MCWRQSIDIGKDRLLPLLDLPSQLLYFVYKFFDYPMLKRVALFCLYGKQRNYHDYTVF